MFNNLCVCVCVVEGRRLPGLGNTTENRQASPFADLAWGSGGMQTSLQELLSAVGYILLLGEERGGWEDLLSPGGELGWGMSRKDSQRRGHLV